MTMGGDSCEWVLVPATSFSVRSDRPKKIRTFDVFNINIVTCRGIIRLLNSDVSHTHTHVHFQSGTSSATLLLSSRFQYMCSREWRKESNQMIESRRHRRVSIKPTTAARK